MAISINNYFKFKWTKGSIQQTEWLNRLKNKTYTCAAYKKLTLDLKTHSLKVSGWKKILHTNRNKKKTWVEIHRPNRL